MPLADAHVRQPAVVVGEGVSQAQPSGVVHVADHHPRPAAERTAEALERGRVLDRTGHQPPDPQRLGRSPCGCRVASDRADHVEALAAARAALDSQLGAVDDQHLGPLLGHQPRAQRLAEDVDPVRNQLPIARRVAALGPAAEAHGGHALALASSGERRVAVGRPARHQRQRLADLAGGEKVAPRTGLALPRFDPRRALQTEPMRRRQRVLLARQRRREAMRPITVCWPAQPPLAPVRRLPIPAIANHPATGMSGIDTARNLHRHASRPPPSTSDKSSPSESIGNMCS